jgi:kynureninase
VEWPQQAQPNLIAVDLQKKIKEGFSKSLPSGRLHFAAHSHHPWPNVTENAQLKYWQDSVQYLDAKWRPIFSKVVPEAKDHLGRLLSVDPYQIVEGTSSFELVTRVFSSFDLSKPVRVLTTDSEFYSFERFIRRFEELSTVVVDRVTVEPFDSFESRFRTKLDSQSYDIVFSSLVFYNTGFCANRLLEILNLAADESTVIVDIYHATGAVPLNLASYCEKLFFVGGGYKYLSAGEGACFLVVPKGNQLRPLMTGWLSEYGALGSGLNENVGYPQDATRFSGSTYDPTGWYRFNAVMNWWRALGINPSTIHDHVRALQLHFIERIQEVAEPVGFKQRLDWGNFLALPLKDSQKVADQLLSQDIFVDARDGLLRVGFGYYQSLDEVEEVANAIKNTIR